MLHDDYGENYPEPAPTLPSGEQEAETWRPRRSAGAVLWVIAALALVLLAAFVVMLRATGGVS